MEHITLAKKQVSLEILDFADVMHMASSISIRWITVTAVDLIYRLLIIYSFVVIY